jgi:hypothetical protein
VCVQNGAPFDLTEVVAGSTISGLEFKVLNQQGEPVPLKKEDLAGTNAGVKVSWSSGDSTAIFPR